MKLKRLNKAISETGFCSRRDADKLIEEGNTNRVLCNPINAALWLVNKICNSGQTMLKGQFISTGSCTKAVKIKPNQKISLSPRNIFHQV